MHYEVKLEDFEGPLDLLLSLIREKKIDILNIQIAEITRQYTEIIKGWTFFDMDEACAYLDMATRLMKIKSALLLPKKRETKEEEDPGVVLQKQIELYALFKEAAERLQPVISHNILSYSKDPEYHSDLVIEELSQLNTHRLSRIVHRIILSDEEIPQNTLTIAPEHYSIDEEKTALLKRLKESSRLSFREFVGKTSSAEKVVTCFLALLELYKTGALTFKTVGNEIVLQRRENAFAQ